MTTPLRSILLLVTELGPGGAETQLKRLAIGLRDRGWRVTLLSLMTPVGFVEELEAHGVAVRTLELSRRRPGPTAVARAVSLARSAAPDVICAFLYHATLLAVVLGAILRAPVVSSIRDPFWSAAPKRLEIARWLGRLRLIDRSVANSQKVADSLLEERAVPPSKLSVIANGLDMTPFRDDPERRSATREALGIRDEEFLWLSVGNLRPTKDHPTLFAAFERLVSSSPTARLRLVALGEPSAELRARMKQLEPRFRFLGERADVPDLMRASDAFVLSSYVEGLPNVVMEALAAGRPVVSTRVGGVPELVQSGQSGLLVEARSPAALAAAMQEIMSLSPEARLRMGAHGRAHIAADFGLESMIDHWEALLSDVSRRLS